MNDHVRILFVSHSFPPRGEPLANVGGMQRVATELHEALERHDGVELSSLVLRATWRMTHVLTGFFLAGLLYRIPHRVRTERTQAVLFSSMVTATLAVLLKPMLGEHGPRLVAIAHGRDVTLPVAPYQWLLERVFQRLDAVLPVSRATARECVDRGLPEHRCHVVPNGVKPERFQNGRADVEGERQGAVNGHGNGKREEKRHSEIDGLARRVNGTQLALCSVGRQVERKGFLWFVDEVMPLLPADVHYWLAGDGPMQEEIEAAAREEALTDRIHLLGKITESELQTLYRSSDLFLMPNVPIEGDMEGFGIVMLEAGLCGLPVIAARLEGIQDVVEEGRNGHLVEPGDPEAYVRAIRPYLEDRPSLDTASERAEAYTREHYTWNRIADRYCTVLRSLVESND